MIVQKFFLGITFCALLVPAMVLAVSDDFIIPVTFFGSDTSAPTAPTLLSVVPVAPTQVDVTWSAATDDIQVAGYRVFRDSVQIATTTLLSYNDVGLTPSTTYSYYIDAFDLSFNFSSTSAQLSTTTPPLPPVATSTPTSTTNSSGGTRTNPVLESFSITPTQTSAVFTWRTSVPTQYTLVWGRTPSYELGSVSGVAFTRDHITTISGLEPGTTYYYELRSTNVRGITDVTAQATFTTLGGAIAQVIPNVRGFRSEVEDMNVRLQWQNTFLSPQYYVRVVRSHLFYPENIQDGAVVYEGTGQSFLDEDALMLRSPQYYTIFVLDGEGAFSSGAVTRAEKRVQPGGVGEGEETQSTSTIPVDIGDDSILRAADISIIQKAITQMFDTELKLETNDSYVISIPYTAVAKNLKSIIVSVQNPSNQKELSSYLLKLNQSGDAYTAAIAGPAVIGTAGIMVEVFDYEAQTVRRISTTISFIDTKTHVPFFPDRLLQYLLFGLPIFVITVGLFWFILLLRRRRKETS